MRVRLRGWFRLITLVPWHEAQARLDHDGPTLEVEQLRGLIAEVPSLATSLRALLFELGEAAPLSLVADAELAERVTDQIRRGYLRVEAEPDLPMSSDEAKPFVWSAPRPEPLAVVDDGEHHWIEVELVDESGAPVAGERCLIVLPNGTPRDARTDHNGLVRVDRTVAGSCTITFPELDADATAPLTDLARAGAQTTPSASFAKRAQHWIEVELVDESGAGVAEELCEIRLPTCQLLRRRTDARGLIRVPSIAAEGDCEIRFPELDADAVAPLSPGRAIARSALSNSTRTSSVRGHGRRADARARPVSQVDDRTPSSALSKVRCGRSTPTRCCSWSSGWTRSPRPNSACRCRSPLDLARPTSPADPPAESERRDVHATSVPSEAGARTEARSSSYGRTAKGVKASGPGR